MAVYSSCLILLVASVTLGAALGSLRGRGRWTAGPAVGLAALMVLASVGTRFPGHGATGAIVLGIGLVGAVLRLGVIAPRPAIRASAVVTGGLALAGASLPFLAAGRVGALGESVTNDLAFHFAWTEALQHGVGLAAITSGYPTGPHRLVAAIITATGTRADAGMLGLLLVTPVLTALAALGALGQVRPLLRPVAATLVGLSYLPFSYFAQGSFKEPILALMVLGAVLVLAEAHAEGGLDLRGGVGLLVLAAGGVADFGAAALVWGAMLGVAALLSGLHPSRRWLTRRTRATAICLALALVLVGVMISTGLSLTFFSTGPGHYALAGPSTPGGNFIRELNPLEALGVWPTSNFRVTPRGGAQGVLLAGAGAIALIYGMVWRWRRDERVLPLALLATAAVWVASLPLTLPYFSGKALAVAAPLASLVSLGALLGQVTTRSSRRRFGRAVVAGAFVLLAAGSSALAGVGALVRDGSRPAELAAIRELVGRGPTLFLGQDDYASWQLRGTDLFTFARYGAYEMGAQTLLPQSGKYASNGAQAVDFDSVTAAQLDHFPFVIAPRTAYASDPPPNLQRVRSGRWYTLWKRTGPTPPRRILDEGGAPGRILDCSRGRRRGLALVRAAPVLAPAPAWRDGAGRAVPQDPGFARVDYGATVGQTIKLPAGRYEVSLRFNSNRYLEVSLAGHRWRMSAYDGDRFGFWSVGVLRVPTGSYDTSVSVSRVGVPGVGGSASIGALALVRLDRPAHFERLRHACGAYVDYYRP